MTRKKIWQRFYDDGVPLEIQPPRQPLFVELEKTAAEFPHQTATEFFGSRLTYRQLLAQVRSFGSSLLRLGLRPGDRLAIMLPNCPQTVIAYYAAFSIGAVVVMTNPMYVEREMARQLNDAGAKVLVGLDHLFPRIARVWEETPVEQLVITSLRDYLPFPLNFLYGLKARKMGLNLRVAYDQTIRPFNRLLAESSAEVLPAAVEMEDLALLQYTGGTTGVAKGVMLTHNNLVANVAQIAAWLPGLRRGRERFLCVLPFFHVFGMTVAMNLPICSGASMTLLPRFEIRNFLKAVKKTRPTIAPLVPTIFAALVNHPQISKYDLSCISYCISGAAPLPLEIMNRFEELTGSIILEGYGLTEASPVTHVNPIKGRRKPGSIGIAIPSTEARIMDLERGARPMPYGQPGELVIRGPQVMKGYWNRPGETAEVLRDGWLYTGDIACMDEEGYVYIVDRKKDLIIAGGFNVYPREVDEVLYEHPKIAEAATIGIPDPYRGETVKAFVVVKQGETLTAEEVICHCRERLAAYKIPRLVEFRRELPKSLVGKILRRKLRAEELAKAGQPRSER